MIDQITVYEGGLRDIKSHTALSALDTLMLELHSSLTSICRRTSFCCSVNSDGCEIIFKGPDGLQTSFNGSLSEMQQMFAALSAFGLMCGIRHINFFADLETIGALWLDDEDGLCRLPKVIARDIIAIATLYALGVEIEEAIRMSEKRLQHDDIILAYEASEGSMEQFRSYLNGLMAA